VLFLGPPKDGIPVSDQRDDIRLCRRPCRAAPMLVQVNERLTQDSNQAGPIEDQGLNGVFCIDAMEQCLHEVGILCEAVHSEKN
jgi:hypothetical protein